MKKKFKRLIKRETVKTDFKKEELFEMSDLKKIPKEDKQQIFLVLKGYVMAKEVGKVLKA